MCGPFHQSTLLKPLRPIAGKAHFGGRSAIADPASEWRVAETLEVGEVPAVGQHGSTLAISRQA